MDDRHRVGVVIGGHFQVIAIILILEVFEAVPTDKATIEEPVGLLGLPGDHHTALLDEHEHERICLLCLQTKSFGL